MAYQSIVVGGRSYGAGLNWRSVSSAADLRAEAKTRGVYSASVVRSRVGVPISAGFLSSEDRRLTARRPSIAGMVARKLHTASSEWIGRKLLLIEKIDGSNKYWLAAFEGGQVYPGTDFVGGKEDIVRSLQEGGFIDDPEFEIGGTAASEFAPEFSDVTFETLVTWDRAKAKAARVVTISASAVPTRQIMLGVLGVMVLVWFSGVLVPEEAAPQFDLATIRKQQLAKSEAALQEAIRKNTAYPSMASFVDAMAPILDGLPIYHAGWSLQKLSCNALERLCDAHWLNTDGKARPDALRAALSEHRYEMSFVNGGETAIAAVPFAPTSNEPELPTTNAKAVYEGLLNDFKPYLNDKFGMVVMEPANVQVSGVKMNNGEPYSMGKVSMRIMGSQWKSALRDMKNTSLLASRVVVSFNDFDIQTQVEGHYVSKAI